ncbi:MAG: uroporphyrinogen-III C-methyltransferase [Chromatiaceae bacterium]|nr:uroporphyrinogen-III C-methyltransferase [Chromatiaceae bacterium]MCP5315268.1 uroporphyrinogen-III C-methyltransferase [Chromatiaceae bacterium]
MNDEDPKPGVVIDVTPEQEPAAPPAHDDGGGAPPARSSTRLTLILAGVALLLVVGGIAFGYRYWQALSQDLAAMGARVRTAMSGQQQLQQSLDGTRQALQAQESTLNAQQDVLSKQRLAVDEARNAFQTQEQKLADENLKLEEREAELRAAVADVHRRVGRSGTQWMIAETDYLLRIANHRLILARDTQTARVALELADQRLRDTQDPGWTGVREQIARDIAKLSGFAAPDIAGMSAQLAALIEQVPQLKIDRATVGPERTLPEHAARAPGERSWDTLLDDLWAGFKDSVRIRERDQPVQAMLAPEHQYFLYENLRLNLQGARLALARGDQALFRDNLQSAAASLDSHFAADDATATAVRSAVAKMLAIDIHPQLPDISQSLRTLEVRQKLMRDIVPGDAEVTQ